MSLTLHSYVLDAMAQAQVRCAREARRLGADRSELASVMFAVLIDMQVANVIANGQTPADRDALAKSVTSRFQRVLAEAEQQLAQRSKKPRGGIIIPDQLPPELS